MVYILIVRKVHCHFFKNRVLYIDFKKCRKTGIQAQVEVGGCRKTVIWARKEQNNEIKKMCFFYFRPRNSHVLDQKQIRQALEEIPSDSDISGGSDDSDFDQNWEPPRDRDLPDSDDDHAEVDDVGPGGDAGGEPADEELPDLDASDVPTTPTTSVGPPKKKARRPVSRQQQQQTEWVWEHEDLPQKDMPDNVMKPKNLDHCRFDVQYFLEVMGDANIKLITEQSNMMRAKKSIEAGKSNRVIPPITEQEVRQWLGIHMYMSVVNMPTTRMHWNLELRNDVVSSVMTKNRFEEISSCFHLSNNDLQPERGAPDYDRLYKIREFISNLSNSFSQLADFEEVPVKQNFFISV